MCGADCVAFLFYFCTVKYSVKSLPEIRRLGVVAVFIADERGVLAEELLSYFFIISITVEFSGTIRLFAAVLIYAIEMVCSVK